MLLFLNKLTYANIVVFMNNVIFYMCTKQDITCLKCGKRFCYKKNLQKHSKVCIGTSIYKCNYCYTTFDTDGILKQHINSVHQENNVC